MLEEYQRQGLGHQLVQAILEWCAKENFVFLTVKTLDESADYPPYNGTRAFYRKEGFLPLEVFPTFWDEDNPCLFLALHRKIDAAKEMFHVKPFPFKLKGLLFGVIIFSERNAGQSRQRAYGRGFYGKNHFYRQPKGRGR